jgi:hypothetical protein
MKVMIPQNNVMLFVLMKIFPYYSTVNSLCYSGIDTAISGGNGSCDIFCTNDEALVLAEWGCGAGSTKLCNPPARVC